MSQTANFALPLLFAAQAQKEITHNEALVIIDALLGGCVEAVAADPAELEPAEGSAWIVGPSPVGAWAGKAAQIAIFTAGGWRFVVGVAGMRMYDRAAAIVRMHDGGTWSAPPAISGASGGMVVDVEARSTVALMLAALRSHGLLDAT